MHNTKGDAGTDWTLAENQTIFQDLVQYPNYYQKFYCSSVNLDPRAFPWSVGRVREKPWDRGWYLQNVFKFG